MSWSEILSVAGTLLNVLLLPILRTLWHIDRRLTILETLQHAREHHGSKTSA